jgi:hypothetical protein
MAITIQIATARLTAYLNAELKVLSGQAVEMDGRKLTRANLKEIRDGIVFWEQKAAATSRTGVQVREIIPR